MAINIRTLQRLRDYTQAVSTEYGLSTGAKEQILKQCRQQATCLVSLVSEKDGEAAYRLETEIEGL